MVKITSYKPVNHLKKPARGKAPSESFDIGFDPETSEAHASTSASAVQNLNLLTGLQEIDDRSLRHKLAQKGQNLLDGLAQLQNQMMNGHVTLSTLKSLEQSLNTDLDLVDNSALSGVVREIKQRVAVELAKFEVAKKLLSSSVK